jgi:hypothetical protein
MADAKTNKQRIQIKVVDIDTNEERVSGEIVVVRGFCTYCCSSCTILAGDGGGPVRVQQ